MQVKKLVAVLTFLIVAGSLIAAEKAPQTTEEITRTAMRANKKALVAQNMNLTPDQEAIFWPLYDDYQIDLNKLNAEREGLIKKFAINYTTMTDELAKDLMDQGVALENKRNDLRKSLISTFGKKFPAKVVGRYYQIENKVDAAMMAEVAGKIPLVK